MEHPSFWYKGSDNPVILHLLWANHFCIEPYYRQTAAYFLRIFRIYLFLINLRWYSCCFTECIAQKVSKDVLFSGPYFSVFYLDASFLSTLQWLWSKWQHNYEKTFGLILVDRPNLDERTTKKRDPSFRLITWLVDVGSKSFSSSLTELNWSVCSFSLFSTSDDLTISALCNLTYFLGI